MSERADSSAWLFTVFRVAFGAYLCVHFAQLLPWATELFSTEGVIGDATLNPAGGIFSPLFDLLGSPAVATTIVATLLALSVLLTLGLFRRVSAVLLWAGWAYLLARNNLILNPSIPYVGLLLLLSALVPLGEPLALGRKRDPHWRMPAMIPMVAWIALAAGYSFSGYTKLISPHWADGSAMKLMLDNPLARGTAASVAEAIPAWAYAIMTWGVIAAELAFLPMVLHRKTRLAAWGGMTVMHFGVLATVGFADLTFGMLVAHLFVLEPRWIAWLREPRERGADSRHARVIKVRSTRHAA